jgi:glycosyltransferase involved in cell wall biosynthesis
MTVLSAEIPSMTDITMAKNQPSMAGELQARKALGRAHLNENRIEEALRIFADILRQFPEDVESFLVLGDCYFAEGEGETALLLYQQAQILAPDNPEIERRIRLAQSECRLPGEFSAEPLPTDLRAVGDLLQRLTGRQTPVKEDEIDQAATLLNDIVTCAHPAQAVADHLDDIDTLLPALLELNIRQARADGRPDLVQALQELLSNIYLQLGTRQIENEVGLPTINRQAILAPQRVLFIGPADGDVLLRQTLPAGALSALGCDVTVATKFPPDFQQRYDVVVTHQPHGDPKLLPGLAACAAANIPIILELDTDYEQMPVTHPDHATLGLGTIASSKAYTASLLLADHICVSNETLAKRLSIKGYPTQVIADGWNSNNELWQKPSPRRSTINLGWIGAPDQVEDVAMIRRILVRIMHEFAHVRLVIVGAPQVYQLFDSLPESRRLFLPTVNLEDYPYLLGQIDILMAPLRNIPYNQAGSDRRLMEAGIRRIPWVASPIPAYIDWDAGGMIADSPEAWHTELRRLILDSDLRASLGRAGHRKAEDRSMNNLGKVWFSLINQVVHSAQ